MVRIKDEFINEIIAEKPIHKQQEKTSDKVEKTLEKDKSFAKLVCTEKVLEENISKKDKIREEKERNAREMREEKERRLNKLKSERQSKLKKIKEDSNPIPVEEKR